MDPNAALADLGAWLEAHWLAVLIVAVSSLVAFRLARPLVHRLVVRAMRVPLADGVDDDTVAAETRKRAETIEDLLSKAIRAMVVLAVIFAILTVLGLLPVIAGLGIVLAGIAFAGQPIVLDYLMGALILAEGQYYKGDWITVGAIQGQVEEVGLRRTIVRDTSGTVHSISNGEIRISSNLTRVYAALLLDIAILRGSDVDRAVAIIDRVGTDMQADPEWAPRLLETPRFSRVAALGETGVTLRVTGKLRAADRWSVPGELRRRLAIELDAAGIELPTRGRLLVTDMPQPIRPDASTQPAGPDDSPPP